MRPQVYLGPPFPHSELIAFYLQTERSGEGGIRTHETAQHRLRDFQSRSFGQLGHLSFWHRESLPNPRRRRSRSGPALCRHHERDMLPGMDQNEVRTVWWEPNAVCLIDQAKLPHTRSVVRCESVEASCAAPRP